MKRNISTNNNKSHFGRKNKGIIFFITAFFCCIFFYASANDEYQDLEKNATIFSTPHFVQQTWLYFQHSLQSKLKKAGALPNNATAMSTAWQITVNRTDPSPQPSGFQMTFRMQLQVSAVDENISYNSQVRFPAQDPTYFTLPTTHPAIENFSLDTQTNEWVVDLQDVIFAGTSIEFDLLARSPNHTTPDGTTFQIEATVTSDNAAPASDSDSGAWSAATNLGIEKYLQFGPDTDALLDIPVRYYLYPCDPAFDPNAFGHLYLSNWTLIDELPTDVVYNNSSGIYDAGSHTVTWSDTTFIKNEDCDFMGTTDYWVEVTFPSTIFGEDAVPPVLEAQNIVTFEGYPTGEEVIPANQLFDSDTLLHGFGLPNPIGDHTKSANTPYFSLQDVTFEGDEAWFFINIRTSSASTTPYYFKIIDPLPCLDYTPNAATQYESQDVHDPACVNPAYQPTNFIELQLYQQYLTISDADDFVNDNPTLPLRYIDTNGNMDTLHVPHISTSSFTITYQIEWADVQAALGSGVGLSNLIWDSEDFDVQVGLTANNLRTAARIYLSGTVAEDTPTYPMLDQYRVRNYAYFYVEAGGQEDSLGFIQDDVIISDTFPIIRPQKTVSESSGLITMTADSEGSPFADNDTLIMTDLLPFGYTFKNESQQYITLGNTGNWSWLSSSGDNNNTPYSELDNYSVRSFIDVEVIDNYNNTGRQLVRAAFLPPPIPFVWEDLSQFRFSYYVNESPMAYSAVNQMEVFPTNPTTVTNLQCQTGLSHAASAAASSDPNDLDGDGITVGEAYCLDTDNVIPSSTIVNIQSYKAVKGDAIVNAPFEPFPAVGDITSSGGTADFQLNLKNIGGIDLEDLVIYDVLPHIGDTGLSETQVGNARGSDFDATFTGIDMATLPTGTIVEYSTSVNACRDELTTGTTPFPTGCVNDWTTTVPAPLSSVKSLRFTFPTGDISTFAPGEAISIEYAVTYPASTQPGEVAWNNFAFAATRADDSSSILPTEPPKVGITIPQIDLSVNKSANPTTISVGEAVTYVLTINHDGAVTEDGIYTLPVSTARDIQLTDNFKSLGLVLVPNSVVIIHDESGLENGVTFDTLTGNIFIPEMGPEDSYTISYEAYSTIEQSANNSLEIISVGNADDIDSTPNNGDLGEDDMDDATVTWVQPAISIRKLIEDQAGSGNYIEADASDGLNGLYSIGQPINYRFIVKNTGSTSLSSVTLTDNLTGFLCDQSVGFLSSGDSSIIDCTWSYGFVNAETPYINTATATGTYNSMEFSAQDSAAAMVLPLCELTINTTYSENCQANANNYTADWKIGIGVVGNFDNDISYQRNSAAVQTHTLTGTTDTLTISNIPADGGLYDTLKVWMTNDLACADTIILKRPVPCPSIISQSCNNTMIQNSGFEDTGSATFSSTFQGSPAELLPRSSTIIPNWTADYSCGGSCPDGYWIDDQLDVVNNPEGDYFIWLAEDFYCARQSLSLTAGVTYQICANVAAFSSGGTQTSTTFAIELFGSGAYNNGGGTLVIYEETLPASTSWNNLNWQEICFNYTAPETASPSVYFSQTDHTLGNTTDGMTLDGICVTPLDNIAINAGEICSTISNTEIKGTVFEDWNYDGIMNQGDTIGVQGIKVYIHNDCNNFLDSTYTDNNGNYEFTNLSNGTTYRIEFDLPEAVACWAKVTRAGADNGTTVQFVQPGNCASLGVADPTGFCEDNPLLSTACYVNGDMTRDGGAFEPGFYDVLVSYQYNDSGKDGDAGYNMPNHLANGHEIGVVWGLAYDKNQDDLYAASFLKRHTGFPERDSLGIIWKTTHATNSASSAAFINLIDLGEDLGQSLVPATRSLAQFTGDPTQDSLVFHLIGKVGLGDLEISDDYQHLYVMNLYQKEVLEISITSETITNRYAIPDMSCTNGETRPFALKYHRGTLYAGAVCTGENGGNANNLTASVFELSGNSFIEIASLPLDYDRDFASDGNYADWQPWINSWIWPSDPVVYPQPLLSDIEFDVDGSLILGFTDRTGHQLGQSNRHIDGTGIWSTNSGGDIIRLCKVDGVFQMEGNSAACAYNVTPLPNRGSGGEFYHGEEFLSGNHYETALGALAMLSGKGEVVATGYSPLNPNTGGIYWLDNTTGDDNQKYEIYGLSAQGSFGKASGLGDLELMCTSAAPLEIGNYVWIDSDGDGIQDACETGIDGVMVELLKGASIIATTETTNGGQYYFSDKNSSDLNLIWTGTDLDTALLANTTYTIRINNAEGGSQQAALNGYALTTTDANSNNSNHIDNDASLNNSISAEITAMTGNFGCADHSFDFGFVATCPTQICLPVKVTVKWGNGTN